jgi:hypothetical protein
MSYADFRDVLIAVGLFVFANDQAEDGQPLSDLYKVQALLILLHQAVGDAQAPASLKAFASAALPIAPGQRIVHPDAAAPAPKSVAPAPARATRPISVTARSVSMASVPRVVSPPARKTTAAAPTVVSPRGTASAAAKAAPAYSSRGMRM